MKSHFSTISGKKSAFERVTANIIFQLNYVFTQKGRNAFGGNRDPSNK